MYEFQTTKYEDKHGVCRVVHLHVPIELHVAHMLNLCAGDMVYGISEFIF